MTLLVAIAALLVWLFVLGRALRSRVDLTTLGLIIVLVGLSSAVTLSVVGVEAPGVWGYLLSGLLFLALWPRGRTAR